MEEKRPDSIMKPGPLKPLIKVNKIPIVERIMLLYKKRDLITSYYYQATNIRIK